MIITAKDNRQYKTASRWIKIRENTKEQFYFTHYNKRYYLNDFMSLAYPIFWEDEEGKLNHISAYDSTTWYNPYLLEIREYCDYIRLWEEITE